MFRASLRFALLAGLLLGLLSAAPASAATTGTICGQVTAFTAPTAATDGSITIDGTVEVIDASASAAIDAATVTTLTAVASADATTCLSIVADADGAIVDIDVAAQATICGDVTLDSGTGGYAVGGVLLPADLVAADAELAALLDAALAAEADVCVDVTIDETTGAFTTVRLDAALTLCGTAVVDADSVTVGGLDVPLALLDAEAAAALAIALDGNAAICLAVEVVDTELVEANLTTSVTACGDVVLEADGDVVVGGVLLPAAVIDADLRSVLEAAVAADADACVDVDATTVNGDTTITVTVTATVCLEVTALTDTTISFGDATFVLVGDLDSSVEVGDVVCATLSAGPEGPPTAHVDAPESGVAPDAGGAGPGTGGMIPDTSVGNGGGGRAPAVPALVLVASLGLIAALNVARRT